jgi:hypothetical protein
MLKKSLGFLNKNFDAKYAEVRTGFQVLNNTTIPRLQRQYGVDNADALVGQMNDSFKLNLDTLEGVLITDKVLLAHNIEQFYLEKNPTVMKSANKVGNVLKSLFYLWYLSFPMAVVYNYVSFKGWDFDQLLENPNSVDELLACSNLKERITGLRKVVLKLKDEKKFQEFVGSFDDLDSNKLFMAFSSVARGLRVLNY